MQLFMIEFVFFAIIFKIRVFDEFFKKKSGISCNFMCFFFLVCWYEERGKIKRKCLFMVGLKLMY